MRPTCTRTRSRFTGVVCGVRIADITDPLMRRVRILDKIVNELELGRPIERVLRTET